jgi:leucyl aminopeptidase
MKVRHVGASLEDVKADILVVFAHGALKREAAIKGLDAALGGRLRKQARAQSFEGGPGESCLVYAGDELWVGHVLLMGAGDSDAFDPAVLKDLSAEAVRVAARLGAKSLALSLPSGAAGDLERAAELAALGAHLGAYRFDTYRQQSKKPPVSVTSVQIVTAPEGGKGKAKAGTPSLAAALRRAETIAEAVANARDFINIPASDMTPSRLAAEARDLAKKHGFTAKVLGAAECKKLGMGMFLGVSQGSAQEPKLIHLTYKPKGEAKRRVALVGKGVMFDTGGYSIKPTAGMLDMKADMSGAAAVVASMGALAALEVPYEVHALAACCENMISGNAIRPSDVLTAMDGTTVEITNTDAEGRLTLGDAITYAREKIQPDEILDFATLTGACIVALGPYTAAVLGNDDELAGRWLEASRATGEDMWRLPLNDRLGEQLKSPVADLKNSGDRWGGTITAALFLKHFARDSRWIHVDIAGPAIAAREQGAACQGGTGFAVATIAEYLRE